MRRRSRIGERHRVRPTAPRLLAGVLVSALLWPHPSAARDGIVVKLATLVPNRSVWANPLREMSAEWKAATEGRVTVRLYPDGVAGDDPDLVRKMRIGQLQAAALTVTGLAEIDPAFALFEIPLFFDSYEEFFHLVAKMEPLFRKRLKSRGFVLLHWAHAGWINLFTARPVTTVDEFKQLKLFVWAGNDSLVSWWRDNGFRPVPLAAIARHTEGRFRREIPQQDRVALAEMEKRGLTVTRVVGTEAEAEWREAAQSFAANMRDALVPSEVFDLALGERELYRRRSEATGA